MDIRANDSDRNAIIVFNTTTLSSSYTMALSSLTPFVKQSLGLLQLPGILPGLLQSDGYGIWRNCRIIFPTIEGCHCADDRQRNKRPTTHIPAMAPLSHRQNLVMPSPPCFIFGEGWLMPPGPTWPAGPQPGVNYLI
jgi:hypothetical protein